MIFLTLSVGKITVFSEDSETKIYNFLTDNAGFNTAVACGILANIEKESSFNPNLYGDSNTSYGICQWHASRLTNLKNYCSSHGYDWTSLYGQLHFLVYELNNLKGDTGNVISKLDTLANDADGAYWAGYYWCYMNERPANKEVRSQERGNLAKTKYWPKYDPNPIVLTSDSRYSAYLPIVAYINQTATVYPYDMDLQTHTGGEIWSTDECLIVDIYTNGWCKVEYQGSGRTRTAFTPLNVFISSGLSQKTAPKKMIVYSRSDGVASIGSVSSGDVCVVASTVNGYTQVIYPLISGGYKTGWTLSSDWSFKESEADERFAPYLPIRGYILEGGGARVDVYDSTYSNVTGKIFDDDRCTINAVYSDGWCYVNYPTTSGNKDAFIKLDKFIHDTLCNPQSYVSDKSVNVYTKADMALSPNWRINSGDSYFVLSRTPAVAGNIAQVLYPVDSQYGGGYKIGWIYQSDIPLDTFTISYNANGGTGAPSAQVKERYNDTVLSSQIPSKEGYTFAGWSTSASSSEVRYKPSAVYSIDSDITLYAVWKPVQYNVTYSMNGGLDEEFSEQAAYGQSYSVSSMIPTKPYVVEFDSRVQDLSVSSSNVNCEFLGWSTDKNASSASYSSGSQITVYSDETLYAVWRNSNIGSLPEISRTNYKFDGWYTEPDGGTKITSAYTVTGDMTLYAHWTATKRLVSVSINTMPDNTSYIQGQEIDLSGLTLLLTYSDRTTEIIDSGYTYTPEVSEEYGPQVVTVNYSGKKVSFEIYVVQAEINISSVSVESPPTKTEYYSGDDLDTSGMTLRVYYSDGSTDLIDYGFSCSPKVLDVEGVCPITVSYGGKTDTFNVNVSSLNIESISVVTQDGELSGFAGTATNEFISSVMVYYNNGVQKSIVSGYTCKPEVLTEPGVQQITVSYNGFSSCFEVLVKNKAVEMLEILNYPNNLEYYTGENIDFSGLSLKAYYNDGTQQVLYDGFECCPDVFTESGTHLVTVSYGGCTTQFAVNIYDIMPFTMQIISLPNKTEYIVGDTLDTDGLVLDVEYNNGTSALITDGYSVDTECFDSTGECCVTVYYEGLSDSFTVNVSDLTEPEKIKGDVDCDGSITLKDAVVLTRWFAGGWDVTIDEENADVNRDGVVNLKDLVTIERYLSDDWNITIDDDDKNIVCTQFVYGSSEMGKDLICYSIAPQNYDRTILLNFAIHGFEDNYAHDGQVLKDLALMLVEHYSQAGDLNNTRVLIVPNANPDGLEDGYSNNTFGRCNANGVDLNRDFDANYVSYSEARNYTPYAFSASESRALRDLCLECNPEIVIDFHGWLNTTIGDQELAQIFYDEMGLAHQVGFTSTNCRGYFANWAHQNGALGLLVEFTNPNVSQSALIRAVDRMIYEEYDNGEGEYAENNKFSEYMPLQCYTLTNGRTTTYREIGVPFDTISYIEGSTDLCTILKVYENGWVKVSYPISSGEKTAYCLLSDFIRTDESAVPYKGKVSANTKVYRREDLSETIGSVWTTDDFYIVSENDSVYQIVFPLDSGGYKMGWINKNSLY